jgi:hypothetical protein
MERIPLDRTRSGERVPVERDLLSIETVAEAAG